jgi:hypothetical protein
MDTRIELVPQKSYYLHEGADDMLVGLVTTITGCAVAIITMSALLILNFFSLPAFVSFIIIGTFSVAALNFDMRLMCSVCNSNLARLVVTIAICAIVFITASAVPVLNFFSLPALVSFIAIGAFSVVALVCGLFLIRHLIFKAKRIREKGTLINVVNISECKPGKKYVIKNAHVENLIIRPANNGADVFVENQDKEITIDSKKEDALENVVFSPDINRLTIIGSDACAKYPHTWGRFLHIKELTITGEYTDVQKGKYPPNVKKITYKQDGYCFGHNECDLIDFSTVGEYHFMGKHAIPYGFHMENADVQSKISIDDECVLENGKLTIGPNMQLEYHCGHQISMNNCTLDSVEVKDINFEYELEILITNSNIRSLELDEESIKKLKTINFSGCHGIGKLNWLEQVIHNKNVTFCYDRCQEEENEAIKQLEEIRKDESSHECQFIVYEGKQVDA